MTPGERALPAGVVLGGGPIAVPVARSLGRAGVRVVSLGYHTDPVRHSRHCAEFVDLGAGEGVQDRWMEWLSERHEAGAVLLPCNDDALELIAHRRVDLMRLGYRAAEANDEVVLAMLDKHRTYELARSVGVPAPRTALVHSGDQLADALEGLSFPVALKPRHSHVFARHFGLHQKALVAADRQELGAHYDRMRALGVEMLLTEIVPGADDAYRSYYTFIDERGEALLHLTKHKLRQYPPGFGLATYHEIDRDPEVIELGLRFFRRVRLRGLGNVEFKRDARDGRLVLIECNHRFTAGYELVRHAGIDLAQLAYGHLAGLPPPPVDGYRTGVRMWHPLEDARAALELRRRGELTLPRWARSLVGRQHFPLFSWRDPGPSLSSWSRFPRRMRGRQARSRAATASATS